MTFLNSGAFFGPSLSCIEAEEWMMLRLYGELSAEQSAALDQHLAGCDNCRREMASLRALEETLAQTPPREPSSQLLAATRLQLQTALDEESEKGFPRWFPRNLLANLQVMRTVPFAAAAMLLAGVGVGSVGGYRYALDNSQKAEPAKVIQTFAPANAPIASVSGVSPQPDGKGITVSYSRLVPESATGSTDDPFIRRVLAMGVQNPTDPSVQDDSVRLLADTCLHGPQCDDSRVRSALMTAARYDGNPALRSKALDGLEPYIAEDRHVRDAVLESVMGDSSPEVREQAIRMLSPVESDSSVRNVLHNVSTRDQDPRVRSMSRTMSQQALDVGLQIQ
jgi:hypothetical protein